MRTSDDDLRAALAALLDQPSPPNYDDKGAFHGLVGGPEHLTVGPHRAWCYQESEWCYPTAPCRACLEPIDQADLRALLDGDTGALDRRLAEERERIATAILNEASDYHLIGRQTAARIARAGGTP